MLREWWLSCVCVCVYRCVCVCVLVWICVVLSCVWESASIKNGDQNETDVQRPMSSCPCMFCQCQNDMVLPLPVQVVIRRPSHVVWFWLTDVTARGEKVELARHGNHTGQKRFKSLRAGISYVVQLWSLELTDEQMDTIYQCAFVHDPRDWKKTICFHDARKHLTGLEPVKSVHDVDCGIQCRIYEPTTTVVSTTSAPPRPTAPPPMPLVAAPPSIPPVRTTRVPQDEDDEDNQPMRCLARAYDWTLLGGDSNEVAVLVDGFDVWTEEVVEELIRWGARPPLHETKDLAAHNIHFYKLECTFVQPSGRLAKGLWINFGMMKAKYGRQVAHVRLPR